MSKTSQPLLFELVVPCLNESQSLPELVHQTAKAAEKFSFSPSDFQLVIVNNGSIDNSKEVLDYLSSSPEGKWFRVVELIENQGYGGGVYAGLKTTTAPWVGFTHADLQCPPEDAFKALEVSRNDSKQNRELVLTKGKRKNRSTLDWLTSRGFEAAVGIFWRFWCFDLNAQPKVFSRDLISHIENPPTGIVFDAYLLKKAQAAQFRRLVISVSLRARKHGESTWAKGISQRWKTYKKVITDLRLNAIKVR